MLRPGDVVKAEFRGAIKTKRRPAVIISTDLYQTHRPDLVLGALTTQVTSATTPLDYLISDWQLAGLHAPSVFRCYFGTYDARDVVHIGRLSDRDWQEKLALAVP